MKTYGTSVMHKFHLVCAHDSCEKYTTITEDGRPFFRVVTILLLQNLFLLFAFSLVDCRLAGAFFVYLDVRVWIRFRRVIISIKNKAKRE